MTVFSFVLCRSRIMARCCWMLSSNTWSWPRGTTLACTWLTTHQMHQLVWQLCGQWMHLSVVSFCIMLDVRSTFNSEWVSCFHSGIGTSVEHWWALKLCNVLLGKDQQQIKLYQTKVWVSQANRPFLCDPLGALNTRGEWFLAVTV